MSVKPGWYSDPWRSSEFRWWDGSDWTGWTRPAPDKTADTTAARTPQSPSPASHSLPRSSAARDLIGDVLAGVDRVTVIDTETTGLYRTDRIVEIALVTMDLNGNILEEFDTLVDPGPRDVGPTWIHHITPTMLQQAPSFQSIADHVAARLDGTVVVGHNLRFDTRMLDQEFERIGFAAEWGVGLDTLRATGCALGVACAEYGITLNGAHRALTDARATAQLLLAVRDVFTTPCHPVAVRPLRDAAPSRVLTRDGFADVPLDIPYLPGLARGVHVDPDVAPYVALLDQAVADLQLCATERAELTAIADDLGLSELDRRRAHREFLEGVIDAALEDGEVTDSELDQLCRVAALLDLDVELVTRRTNPLRLTHDTLTLEPGMTVCFTGAAVDDAGNLIDRSSVLAPEAIRHGLIPNKSLTRTCGLLIVADQASESSKAMTARRNGTPVATVADYRAALVSGQPVPVTRLAANGVALVCVKCGASWMAARRSSNPICAGCAPADQPIRTPVPAKTLRQLRSEATRATTRPPANETLVCSECGDTWPRPRTRGRPPKRCPQCAGKTLEVQP